MTAFEAKFGRAPNGLERDRLQRQATFATRSAKTHDGETVEQRLERWDRQLKAEVAGGLAEVAQDVLDIAGQQPDAPAWSPPVVIETALADIQAKKAAWTRPDLARAISDALPDNLGGLDAAQIRAVIDGLTDQAIRDHAVELTADAPGATSLAGRAAPGRRPLRLRRARPAVSTPHPGTCRRSGRCAPRRSNEEPPQPIVTVSTASSTSSPPRASSSVRTRPPLSPES